MANVRAHNIEIAANGSIYNAVVESLASAPTLNDAGRYYYNTTSKRAAIGVHNNAGDTIVERLVSYKDELDTHATLQASQTTDEGSALVGFDGHASATGGYTAVAASVQNTLDWIIDNLGASQVQITTLEDGVVYHDGSVAMTGNLNLNSYKIAGLANGIQATDAVNLSQLQSVQTGTDPKESVRLATTTNVAGTYNNTAGTITGSSDALLVIDGERVYASDRIGIKNNTNGHENGIYDVTASGSSTVGGAAQIQVIDTVADSAGSLGGKFFFLYAGDGTKYYCWIDVANGNVDPNIADFTGIEVDISANATANDVATAVAAAIDSVNAFGAASVTNSVTVTNAAVGNTRDAIDAKGSAWVTGFTFNAPSTNGEDAASAYVLTRSYDADNTPDVGEVTSGMYFMVEEGGTNANNGFQLTTDDPITLGTTDLLFVQFTGATELLAGTGLSKSGNRLDVNLGAGVIYNSTFIW